MRVLQAHVVVPCNGNRDDGFRMGSARARQGDSIGDFASVAGVEPVTDVETFMARVQEQRRLLRGFDLGDMTVFGPVDVVAIKG